MTSEGMGGSEGSGVVALTLYVVCGWLDISLSWVAFNVYFWRRRVIFVPSIFKSLLACIFGCGWFAWRFYNFFLVLIFEYIARLVGVFEFALQMD